MIKFTLCLLAALLLGVPVAAPGDVHDHARHRRFAWLANDPTNTYDNATLAGIQDVVGVLGHAVDPFYAGFDLKTQLAQCRQALHTHRYSGLFVDADDAVGIEPCVAEARREGVPVVAIDLPIG